MESGKNPAAAALYVSGMMVAILSRISEEARSPAFPLLMPSDTAITKSSVEIDTVPVSFKDCAPPGPDENTIQESSLRSLRDPLLLAAAQLIESFCDNGFMESERNVD